MSDISPRLKLPYIAPAQAQKHVTHNEALQRLDALAHLSFVAVDVVSAPATPQAGDLYAIGAASSGEWTDHAGQIAYWGNSGWHYFEPMSGWRAWDLSSGQAIVYDGSAWQPEGGGTGSTTTQNLTGLGIGTTSDAINRLAVSSDATLLNHAGAGHQLKLNKASDGDVASLLFQSNWLGHAEMGLSGGTDFGIKVTDDGASWIEALAFDAATGLARGAAVQSAPDDTTAGRLATTDGTFGPASVLAPVGFANGVPSGGVIESGSTANGSYVRFADGTQMCWVTGWSFAEEDSGSRLGGGDWIFPMPFVQAPTVIPTYGNTIGTAWVGTNTHRRLSCFACDPTTTSAGTMQVHSVESTPFSSGAQANGVQLFAAGRWA